VTLQRDVVERLLTSAAKRAHDVRAQAATPSAICRPTPPAQSEPCVHLELERRERVPHIGRPRKCHRTVEEGTVGRLGTEPAAGSPLPANNTRWLSILTS
jgi:hypothetical protein